MFACHPVYSTMFPIRSYKFSRILGFLVSIGLCNPIFGSISLSSKDTYVEDSTGEEILGMDPPCVDRREAKVL